MLWRKLRLGGCVAATLFLLFAWGRGTAGNDKLIVDHLVGDGSYWIVSLLSSSGSVGIWRCGGDAGTLEKGTTFRYLGPGEVNDRLPGGAFGFVFSRQVIPATSRYGQGYLHFYMVPYWGLVMAASVWPLRVLGRRRTEAQRRLGWCCAHCGYSQRGVKLLCPECGRDAVSGDTPATA